MIHELWCLGLDGTIHKVHTTSHVEVTSGTVGEFVINQLAENGRRIKIIRQLSVNNSVQFLDLSDQSWGSGLPFIFNLLYHVEATGWGGGNYLNQKWGGRVNDANSITNVAWGASVDPRPA